MPARPASLTIQPIQAFVLVAISAIHLGPDWSAPPDPPPHQWLFWPFWSGASATGPCSWRLPCAVPQAAHVFAGGRSHPHPICAAPTPHPRRSHPGHRPSDLL
ncbi:hypothetical protein B0J15DRAFT_504130 [Fusarium solani]|uniref:Uncharacterized protein n=1 Tax=Fusarium solani TaxID=169388 RepID=A0A9P9G912_FUSSL|nr:uncharacterized protein B0J15DRAFT_504130 [Fusarium solani]KAH7235233.1 hypothetical protein B0J15DRAFT_504130 [Fusarium solani]